MPSKNVNISDTKFADVIAALEDRREDLVGERGTDDELHVAWLEGQYTELVYKHKRRVIQGTVSPDTGIVEIT